MKIEQFCRGVAGTETAGFTGGRYAVRTWLAALLVLTQSLLAAAMPGPATGSGSLGRFNLLLESHNDLTRGLTVMLEPSGWVHDYLDVPPGTTNLVFQATNLTVPPQTAELFVKFGAEPALTNYDERVQLTNSGSPGPGGVIAFGPPIAPGRYWVGLYNAGTVPQTNVFLRATFTATATYASAGPVPIPDAAVMTNSIYVPVNAVIASTEVGLRVDHSQVSDLVFHLISPRGTRVLLVENRGDTTAGGMGATLPLTGADPIRFSGCAAAATNVIQVAPATGTLVVNYNFYSVPSRMVVYDQSGNPIFNSGCTNGSGTFNLAYTNSSSFVIVMNPDGGQSGAGWEYTVNAQQAGSTYLVLTDDTNRTTTPIGSALPPFVGGTPLTAGVSIMSNGFEGYPEQYEIPSNTIASGWLVVTGEVDIFNPGAGVANSGTNILDLNGLAPGAIATNFATIPDENYRLTFAYTKNPVQGHGFVASANFFITGLAPFRLDTDSTDNSYDDLRWRTNTVYFRSASTNTTLQFSSLNPGSGGMFLDTINVNELVGEPEDVFCLPEQSLDAVRGEDARGTWQLEIQDTRAGNTNPAPSLVSWRIHFTFAAPPSTLTTLAGGVLLTNTIPADGIAYYQVTVPTNADCASNILVAADAPLNVLYSRMGLPTGTNPDDYFLMFSQTNGLSRLSTNSAPTNIVPGGVYYLGIQNTNGVPVNFGIEVDFYPPPPPPPLIFTAAIAYTNPGGTNGFRLTWCAPTNDLFRVQWTTNLASASAWNQFTNLVRYTGPVTPTNGLFSFFDNGSQTGGFGLLRWYRVLQVSSANILTLPAQTNRTASVLLPLVVTNTATDSDPAAVLGYVLTSAPAGASIDAAGIITWTPGVGDAFSANVITTVVTDNGVPVAHATNSFTVTVGPPPPMISSVTMTTNGNFQLSWAAPTNYEFQVAWTTNLMPPVVWNCVPPEPPYLTSGETNFTFVDTNAAVTMKFYRLIRMFP
jgi:subtilisin-like proprotein convertase family protein